MSTASEFEKMVMSNTYNQKEFAVVMACKIAEAFAGNGAGDNIHVGEVIESAYKAIRKIQKEA